MHLCNVCLCLGCGRIANSVVGGRDASEAEERGGVVRGELEYVHVAHSCGVHDDSQGMDVLTRVQVCYVLKCIHARIHVLFILYSIAERAETE